VPDTGTGQCHSVPQLFVADITWLSTHSTGISLVDSDNDDPCASRNARFLVHVIVMTRFVFRVLYLLSLGYGVGQGLPAFPTQYVPALFLWYAPGHSVGRRLLPPKGLIIIIVNQLLAKLSLPFEAFGRQEQPIAVL
jgi:hypothetical protein